MEENRHIWCTPRSVSLDLPPLSVMIISSALSVFLFIFVIAMVALGRLTILGATITVSLTSVVCCASLVGLILSVSGIPRHQQPQHRDDVFIDLNDYDDLDVESL